MEALEVVDALLLDTGLGRDVMPGLRDVSDGLRLVDLAPQQRKEVDVDGALVGAVLRNQEPECNVGMRVGGQRRLDELLALRRGVERHLPNVTARMRVPKRRDVERVFEYLRARVRRAREVRQKVVRHLCRVGVESAVHRAENALRTHERCNVGGTQA